MPETKEPAQLDRLFATAWTELGRKLVERGKATAKEIGKPQGDEPPGFTLYRKAMGFFVQASRSNPADARWEILSLAEHCVYTDSRHRPTASRPGEAVAFVIQGLKALVEADPTHANSHNRLGNFLEIMGQPEEAMACYREAIRQQADAIAPRVSLSSALRKLGVPAHEYLPLLDEARKLTAALKPTEVKELDAAYNQACIEAAAGNLDLAFQHFEAMLKAQTGPLEQNLEWPQIDPDFHWLRGDPRYEQLIQARLAARGIQQMGK
jgi:tetratricopeptide (TPR) repeat protein